MTNAGQTALQISLLFTSPRLSKTMTVHSDKSNKSVCILDKEANL